jgi:hypothetical protein
VRTQDDGVRGKDLKVWIKFLDHPSATAKHGGAERAAETGEPIYIEKMQFVGRTSYAVGEEEDIALRPGRLPAGVLEAGPRVAHIGGGFFFLWGDAKIVRSVPCWRVLYELQSRAGALFWHCFSPLPSAESSR